MDPNQAPQMHEKLRRKHIQTLEVLQQVMDENTQLRRSSDASQQVGIEDQLKMYQKDIELLQKEVFYKDKYSGREDLMKEKEEMHSNTKSLKAELKNLGMQNQFLEKECNDAKEQNSLMLVKEDEMQAEIKSLKCRVDKVNGEVIPKYSEKIHQLENCLFERERELEAAKLKIADYESKCEKPPKKEQKLRRSSSQLQAAQYQLELLINREKELMAELESVQHHLQVSQERNNENEKAMLQLQDKMRRYDKLETDQKNQKDLTKSELENLQERIAAFDELQENFSCLLKENHQLRQEVENLRMELEQAKKPKNISNFKDYVEVKRENQRLRMQIEGLRSVQSKYTSSNSGHRQNFKLNNHPNSQKGQFSSVKQRVRSGSQQR
eukprot:CAMPEP_0117855912 /NCGR_PEP_ID=MMETSP0950-20121206/921_1 /TAXON_ID=44440 /ORGANISM="Chattonella subsalsa, Strain CCMP2191" /LENGTH=381 /DNA_ID=CAMNT_0005704887 /DNA_START=30 /DNA_END=1171 /DNA_ORIENTATION=-